MATTNIILWLGTLRSNMRGFRKFSQGGGGPNSQKGLAKNFNMAKINNLAIPEFQGGGGPEPLSHPLDPPMSND